MQQNREILLAQQAEVATHLGSPKSGTEVRQTVRGSFVGGAVHGQTPDGKITLTGQLSFSTTRPQAP